MFEFGNIKTGKTFILLQQPFVAVQPVFRKGVVGAERVCDGARFQIAADQECLLVFFEEEGNEVS